MAFHDLFFARVKTPRLVENNQGNARLADIVQGGSQSEPLYVCIGELDTQGEADRHAGHQQAMLERSLVIAAYIVKPDPKPVLLDTVDDIRCAVLGIRKLWRIAF